ncbi:ElyC/SanA/YdcF family protein [candidate division CSSED10-310 bacterium]|uniref:ElyC/SanA/YdcF family protein n=1 Tax=candidate division CSSED10-310 bacterium TaxID=2855610 RepID=A0ABV6Z343_UNCC1
MFLIKKIFAPFFFPLSICIELLLIGLFLLWFSKKQKMGRIFVTIGVVLIILLSFTIFSDLLLNPLESFHAPLLQTDSLNDVEWIVVLGGGHTSDQRLPLTSQLSESSLVRLIEAIRLHLKISDSKIILSGGGAFDPTPHARLLAEVAISLGVDPKNLVMESGSNDTKDEANLIKAIVGKKPFILVTSASHMPRSIALFRKVGLKPIPAPVGHLVKNPQKINPSMFYPNTNGLRQAHKAVYEYLGLLWAKIRNQI